jgi:hypothetical protein
MPRRRHEQSPEADQQTINAIVDEIKNCDRVSPPSEAERAERRERDRERERRRRERDRIAEEERAREALERKRIERERQEQERRAAQLRIAEEAKASMAAQQQRNQAAAERRQVAGFVQEWTGFKAGLQQAQIEQQRESYIQDLQSVIDGLGRVFNPPPPPEPQIIYYVEEEDTRWGKLPTLPTWR